MTKVFTIGFTKKTAEQFFETLSKNGVKKLVDVRLNNKSQLAAFAKEDDLRYFLKKICAIEYLHLPQCAPSEDLLKKYQKKEIDWKNYETEYKALIRNRNVVNLFTRGNLADACFLCSEPTAEQCHRRLLVEHLKEHFSEIEIVHL